LTPYILETLRAIKKSGLIWLFSDFRGEDLNVKVYEGKKNKFPNYIFITKIIKIQQSNVRFRDQRKLTLTHQSSPPKKQ
jgi:hypothetical protein